MQSSHGDNVLENLNKEKDRRVNTLKTTFYQDSVFQFTSHHRRRLNCHDSLVKEMELIEEVIVYW